MTLILFDFIINEAVQTDNKCCVIIVQMTEYRRIITGPAQWIPSSFCTSVLRCKRDTKQLCSTAVLVYQRRSQRSDETHVANGERERLNRKRNRKDNTDEGNKNKRSRHGDLPDKVISNKSKQVNTTVRFLFNIPLNIIIIGLFFFLSREVQRMLLLHLYIPNGGVGH